MPSERSFLVSITLGDITSAEESLAELALLSQSAGAKPVGAIVQHRSSYDPATLIGKGKLEELKAEVVDVDLVIFDQELSPAQERNLSQALKTRVLDRTALVLDIFALHAATSEGKIQVELAQLQYLLPRLKGGGGELSRLGGGIGTRGPGETQLEVDRRKIRGRITALKRELDEVTKVRQTKRRRRNRTDISLGALVGYTNTGKSSLLNSLTGAEVLVRDQLFATLDPTTRRLELDEAVLLTDTVGFVRRLPHQLVAAFKSTLEEATLANLLIHVVDVTEPDFDEKYRVVRRVLAEIGAADIPEIIAANKCDIADETQIEHVRTRYPECVVVSARTGEGLSELRGLIGDKLRQPRVAVDVVVPYAKAGAAARLWEKGEVELCEYGADGVHLIAQLPVSEANRLKATLEAI